MSDGQDEANGLAYGWTVRRLFGELGERDALVHAALMATALLWGLNVSAVKALATHVDVMLVASVRTVLAAAALTLLLIVQRTALPRWPLRFWSAVVLGAGLMVYANQTLYVHAMQHTSATNAALIMALAPMVSAVLEALLFRKALGLGQCAGIAVALAGVSVVILYGRGGTWSGAASGDVPMLASVLAFAAGGATVQRLSKRASALAITWLVHVIGASMLVLNAWVSTPDALRSLASLSAWQWGLMVYSGVLATASAPWPGAAALPPWVSAGRRAISPGFLFSVSALALCSWASH